MNKLITASLAAISLFKLDAYAENPPNIVIYLTDDQSQLDASIYGAEVLKTPNLDRLAENGIVFDNAFVASPACAPSRAALLTGLMPARNGAEANHTYPKKGTPVLTQELQKKGYEVLAFGKVAHMKMNWECGFDFYHSGMTNLANNVTNYFDSVKVDEPVCLMVGDRRPHVPWTTEVIYDPNELKLPPYFIDTPETRKLWAQYYSDIEGADQEMGKIYDMAKQKFGDNFIFIYTADHGGQWPFGKWNLYDAGIQVPLVVVWPDHIKPKTRTDAMVSWIDIFPTVLELTGCNVPENIDGKSFKDVLAGKSDEFRDYIFTTHTGDGNMNVYPIRSVRNHRYKYIRNLHPEYYHSNHSDILRKKNAGGYWDSWDEVAKTDQRAAGIIHKYYQRPAEEFYDLQADPTEQVNLIDSEGAQEQIKKMRDLLLEWMKVQGDQESVMNTPYPISGPVPHIVHMNKVQSK
ncbi:sulfatase family protein [Sunxiuqinia sp. A32]|uniref:sulfatase family protein n=1 Tax=Sunxiuqinia sp. A32 TaxID=3461496 RepID=UPI004046160C